MSLLTKCFELQASDVNKKIRKYEESDEEEDGRMVRPQAIQQELVEHYNSTAGFSAFKTAAV